MLSLTANPRTVTEADFPAAGTPEEQWLFLLNYALLAPSEYNTQPWKFRGQGSRVDMVMDTSRRLPVVDPDDREMLISCGAACLNLCLAARHVGYLVRMENVLLDEQPELLARLELCSRKTASDEDERLFQAIPFRHTNRSVYEERRVPDEVLLQMQHEVGREGAWLHLVQYEETRQEITRLIVAGDREQWADKRFRHELAEWVHPRSERSADGLPGSAQARGSL